MKKIIKTLNDKKRCYFNVEEIKKFLDDNPEIFKLNSHVIRNEQYNIFEKK